MAVFFWILLGLVWLTGVISLGSFLNSRNFLETTPETLKHTDILTSTGIETKKKLLKLLNLVELTLDLIVRGCLVLKARRNRQNLRIIRHRQKSKINSMHIYMKIVAYNRYLALNSIQIRIENLFMEESARKWPGSQKWCYSLLLNISSFINFNW